MPTVGGTVAVAPPLAPGVVNLTGEVDPTGGGESGVTINSAIASLGAGGGQVLLPPNPAGGQASFKCNEPIVLGNGSGTAPSTVNGVQLVGAAPAGSSTLWTPPARLFAGVTLSQLVVIQGPCFGNGLRNLFLDPAGHMTAGTMLTVISGQFGRFADLALTVPGGGIGISESIVGGAVGNQNTMHNRWDQIAIAFANTNTSTAWVFTATGSTFNCCYESIQGVYMGWGAAAAAQTITAFQFTGCDNVKLRDIHLVSVAPVGTNRGALFDYSLRASKPADVLMEAIDFGGVFVTIANNGAPTGATINRIIPVAATNGIPGNPNLANLAFNQPATTPQSSGTFAITSGTAVQNTTGGDVLITGAVSVSSATAGAQLTIGTAPTSAVAPNSFTGSLPTISAQTVIPFSAVVPAGFWLLLSTTGTITVGSITAVAIPL